MSKRKPLAILQVGWCVHNHQLKEILLTDCLCRMYFKCPPPAAVFPWAPGGALSVVFFRRVLAVRLGTTSLSEVPVRKTLTGQRTPITGDLLVRKQTLQFMSWVMTPCVDVARYRRFGGPGWNDTWKWRQHDPPKRRYPTTILHGVTT